VRCLTCAAWQALRASTAAPLYFREVPIGGRTFVDGGLIANNPAAIALHEARLLFPGVPVACLASFGTGRRPPMTPTKPPLAPPWWLTMNTLVRASTRTEDIHALLADTLPAGMYFRFNPPVPRTATLDASDVATLRELQAIGRGHVSGGGGTDDMHALASVLRDTVSPLAARPSARSVGSAADAEAAPARAEAEAPAEAPAAAAPESDAGPGDP